MSRKAQLFMVVNIRRLLWGAFAALVVLVVLGLTINAYVLNEEARVESATLNPEFVEKAHDMDDDVDTMVTAARGYALTHESRYEEQYENAWNDLEKSLDALEKTASDPKELTALTQFKSAYQALKKITDKQMQEAKVDVRSPATVSETSSARRTAHDRAGSVVDEHYHLQANNADSLKSTRSMLLFLLVLGAIVFLAGAAYAITRIESSMTDSITRQVRRTEAMIAGMADGVMLVDAEGRTVFINPAGQKLIGGELGVTIFKHAETYGFRKASGGELDARELPASQALATGRPVRDATIVIMRG